MAENLHAAGMEITVVEMAEQVMVNLDYEMAAEVHHHLRAKGVNLLLKDGVASFREKGRSVEVVLSSGRAIAAGIVILSIGVGRTRGSRVKRAWRSENAAAFWSTATSAPPIRTSTPSATP